MSRRDISSLHELISDDFSDFPSEWLESHMSHRDISSLHELIADEFSEILSLWLDGHMSYRDIFFLHAKTVYAKLKNVSMKSGIHIHDR